jgi:hypothetical protein
VLSTWERFRRRARIAKKELPAPATARALLAAPVERWVGKARAAKLLPW